nr:RNA-directed DNA polymerase, eukaryota [Tanacetum cinerariifolium]
MWDVSLFKKHKVLDGDEGFIAILGEWLNVGTDFLMVVVYAPQDASKKQILWIRLRDLNIYFQVKTIVLGDFNVVHSQSERLGCIFCKIGAKAFNDFITESDLVDLPMSGLITLPRHLSDHCLLLLKSHSCDYGPIPFKFFNSWLLDVELSPIVHRSWSSSHVTSGHQLLVTTRQNDKVSRDLRAKVDNLNIKVESGLNEIEIEERLSYLKKIEDFDHLKNLDLVRNAKVKWAIEGDENSKYFHGIVNNKFSRSRINGIFSNGVWLTDPSLVTLGIYEFYKEKFRATTHNWLHFNNTLLKSLPNFESSFLDNLFTCQEIKNAVWDYGGSEASGPDRFSFKFIPSYWDIIGEDFSGMVKKFEIDRFIRSGKWRMWIRGCLKSAYGLVLVNGSPTREFKIEKGLHQGEALSPFLFIIAVEALHVSLQEAKSRNLFE